MTLTGPQLSRIHKAILDAYNRDELRQMIGACMDEDFAHHVSAEKAYSAQVSDFIEWANRQGRALELLRCAAEGNERNAGLQTLWAEAKTWDAPVQPAKATEPSISPAALHHIFLAYSRKDDAVMRRLRDDLLTAGIVAWVDQDDLEPGTPVWQRAIEAAIRVAKCVVVILTPDAKESDWVNTELSFARRIQRRIFPVLAGGNEDSAVPFLLEATNRIDIRTDYAGSVQGKLIPALRKHLGMIVVAKPPIEIEWVTIPAGEFLMGSDTDKDNQAFVNETPQHRLFLSHFQIAKYPITNTQYQAFVKATGYHVPDHWQNGTIPKDKERHPVVNVAWQDARAFCRWAGVRLPSEAEWEKAARGMDGRIWPWGNEPPTKEHCNYSGNVGDTTPVDKYPKGAGPYGCLDMVGNTLEWTSSLFKPYPYRADDGREDPKIDDDRIVRGGSFWQYDYFARCASRRSNPPWLWSWRIGFRVVSPGF